MVREGGREMQRVREERRELSEKVYRERTRLYIGRV